MTAAIILTIVILLILFSVAYPRWRDGRILNQPFPETWLEIVECRLTFFSKLKPSEQHELLNMIKLFVAKKNFYGCGGLELNDDIKITIAAEACLLLLNRQNDVYPELHHILVYPHAFKAGHKRHNADGTINESEVGLLGESWGNGKVILSWDDVESGVENFLDGHNVVLHEFSHQLDSESGSTNGAPPLRKNSYPVWAKVLSTEFQNLIDASDNHDKSVMDYYGATNPAEFFAVATETFFEKPRQMWSKQPELFEQLKTYYCVDPREWLD